MIKSYLMLCIICCVAACAPKTYTRSPEMKLKVVDEHQQPVAGVTVLNDRVDKEFVTNAEGDVMLPARTETLWTPLLVPGSGTYVVYGQFLIAGDRFLPMNCSCRTINRVMPDCPEYTVIQLYAAPTVQTGRSADMKKRFTETGLPLPDMGDHKGLIKINDQVECRRVD